MNEKEKINKRPITPKPYHQVQLSTILVDRLARLKRKGKFKSYDELLRNDYGLGSISPTPTPTTESDTETVIQKKQPKPVECPYCKIKLMRAMLD